MSNADQILDDVIACLERQHQETLDKFVGKPCVFGVGLPSAIASTRNKIIEELVDIIHSGIKESNNE